MAAGGRRGLAYSIIQVGGDAGSSLSPLLAALIITRRGRSHAIRFSLVALAAIVLLSRVGRWYKENAFRVEWKIRSGDKEGLTRISHRRVIFSK